MNCNFFYIFSIISFPLLIINICVLLDLPYPLHLYKLSAIYSLPHPTTSFQSSCFPLSIKQSFPLLIALPLYLPFFKHIRAISIYYRPNLSTILKPLLNYLLYINLLFYFLQSLYSSILTRSYFLHRFSVLSYYVLPNNMIGKSLQAPLLSYRIYLFRYN